MSSIIKVCNNFRMRVLKYCKATIVYHILRQRILSEPSPLYRRLATELLRVKRASQTAGAFVSLRLRCQRRTPKVY